MNSTISGNSAPAGAGLAVQRGTIDVRYSTITENAASLSDGAGILSGVNSAPGSATVTLKSTIVAGNSGSDLAGTTIESDGFNLVGAGDTASFNSTGDMAGISDAGLSPLGFFGGSTPTHGLVAGSLAIDAGDPDFESPPANDQRGDGFARLFGSAVDIGAFELQPVLTDPDFDDDGRVDLVDIDMLVDAIVNGGDLGLFDLTMDGQLDVSDRDEWLRLAGGINLPSQAAYLLGDSNLDGFVDVSDFNIWNSNKFSAGSGLLLQVLQADPFVTDLSEGETSTGNETQGERHMISPGQEAEPDKPTLAFVVAPSPIFNSRSETIRYREDVMDGNRIDAIFVNLSRDELDW